VLWSEFRRGWDNLVRARSCEVFDVHLVWWDGELKRL
jgi:hypothetical protein